jgi:hypothetical protein
MADAKLPPARLKALLEGPAHPGPGGTPASWKPNVHSSLQQGSFYTCVPLCAAVSGALVIVRMYIKVNVVRKLDLSDCKPAQMIILCNV